MAKTQLFNSFLLILTNERTECLGFLKKTSSLQLQFSFVNAASEAIFREKIKDEKNRLGFFVMSQ